MEILLAHIVDGIRIGFIYGVVVTGYNLLALVTGMMHWSYSHLLVLAMYVAWLVLGLTGGNIVLSIGAALLAGTVISTASGFLFVPFIKRRAVLEGFVVSLGIAIIVTEVMSHWLNNGNTIVFPSNFSGQQALFKLGMTSISFGDLLTLVGSIVIVLAFFWFLNRTKQGLMFRTVAQDSNMARILGISVNKMSIFSFGLAGLMGGISAIFLALTLGCAAPSTGDTLAMKCLAILLFASIGNLKGGLICALILGIAESLTAGYLAGQWVNAISLTIVVLVLLFKPEGVFGPQY